MKTNTWWTIKNQSLAVYTRNAGFDLAVYDQYSDGVKEQLRARSIRAAVAGIKAAFAAEAGTPLEGINKGVYVISLSNPLAISYRHKWSPVIYIGMGNIATRIDGHFKGSLFDFMQSLSGANFDFDFCCPSHPTEPLYYKHVEHLMLEYFSQKVGGRDDRYRFPILNSNAGSNKAIDDGGDWWRKPLKASGKRPLWAIEPTQHSDFAPLD